MCQRGKQIVSILWALGGRFQHGQLLIERMILERDRGVQRRSGRSIGEALPATLWSRDGKELFYVPNADQLMVVTIRPQPSFTFMNPVAVPRRIRHCRSG
jgi:hypothetical protein